MTSTILLHPTIQPLMHQAHIQAINFEKTKQKNNAQSTIKYRQQYYPRVTKIHIDFHFHFEQSTFDIRPEGGKVNAQITQEENN